MRLIFIPHGVLRSVTGLVIAMCLVAACSSSSSPTSTMAPAPTATLSTRADVGSLTVEVTRDIVYAIVDDSQTELDVYAPSEPGLWPVVVVVHGAFPQHRGEFVDLSEAISSEGAVAYNIDAIFSVPFLSGIERIACAVRFARATAGDYGGDPDRITLVGNSAGAVSGTVVALAGDDFEGDCVVADGSALIDAIVAFEGPYDYATTIGPAGKDHSFLKDEDPELLHAIDPYSHIGRNLALQVRLVHGDPEEVSLSDIPLETSIAFHRTLADAGYDAELIVLEGATHNALTSKYFFPEGFALTVQTVMELARGSSP